MAMDFRSSFQGRSVLVTGHTGFKGSWLCLWLSRLGARVSGYALDPPTRPSHFSIAEIKPLLDRHYVADVRDLGRFRTALREVQPDLVLHLAAQSVVRMGYQQPIDTFGTNVMGTINVLEAVRTEEIPCAVLCVTSDKCYQNREQIWGYRESDALGDHDPYGASKGAAELAIRAYRDSYFQPERVQDHGVRLASARAGNVIGGGDWTAHALMVDIVGALSHGQAVQLRNPNAYRPWQHVLQCLSGYLTISARLLGPDGSHYCSSWNIGPRPGDELPVHEIAETFIREWGKGAWRDASDPSAPREAGILRLSIDKALWELPWRPAWNTLTTLRETARWYRAHLDGDRRMQDVSLDQITAYEANALERRN